MLNLKKHWRSIYQSVIGTTKYFYLTPSHYTLTRTLQPIITTHASGKILDAGAGEMTYRFLLEPRSNEYVPVDKYQTHPAIKIADIERLPFTDGFFDTVFCSQVIEHVPHPWIAFSELSRTLKKGGKMILTVPHLSYLHGEPEDFYRFTKHALSRLAEEHQLHTKSIVAAGGLIAFLLTPVAIAILAILSYLPLPQFIGFGFIKYFSILASLIDNKIDQKKLFALNYVAVFEKL